MLAGGAHRELPWEAPQESALVQICLGVTWELSHTVSGGETRSLERTEWEVFDFVWTTEKVFWYHFLSEVISVHSLKSRPFAPSPLTLAYIFPWHSFISLW